MKLITLSAAALLLAAAQPARAQSDWAPCADEGQTCRVQGQALVRFGVPGRYAFRVVDRRIACDTEEFGDPAFEQVKRCEVSYQWRRDERYRDWRDADAPAASGWRWCANEGDACRAAAGTRVRYGAQGSYAYRNVPAQGALACQNGVFGDPRPDVAKQCDYETAADTGAGPGPGGRSSLVWERCADERGRCNPARDTVVRYGSDERWLYREVAGRTGIECSNRNFGGDPAPQRPKRCEALRLGR